MLCGRKYLQTKHPGSETFGPSIAYDTAREIKGRLHYEKIYEIILNKETLPTQGIVLF